MNYITLVYPQTASIRFQGYMYDHLQSIYLSSAKIPLPSLTAVNAFTNSHKVSALCPAFSGYEYPTQYYNVVDKNILDVNIIPLSGNGQVDIILFNRAGYTKMSDGGTLISITS